MVKIVHYTPKMNEGEILLNGLKPKTPIMRSTWRSYILDSVAQEVLFRQEKFIFCFLDGWEKLWKGCWVLGDNAFYRAFRGKDSSFSKLSFELNGDDVYVLDANFYIKALNCFHNSPGNVISQQISQYFNSRIHLANYQGNYQVPELIIANNVAPERLTLEGHLTHLL